MEKNLDFISHYDKHKSCCIQDETILFINAIHPTQATKIIHGWIHMG
ncbi:Mobile element protein [Candidatus Enterovibrio escicola]|uniref:Mobile element protein n=1 Tax=Candidatus Enterovibrio escicola TaxID=1927127 RepID=A0A2A5T2X5_9GAMM|nr:Mobile element protein [Candidatus Enterovibrio escacola]